MGARQAYLIGPAEFCFCYATDDEHNLVDIFAYYAKFYRLSDIQFLYVVTRTARDVDSIWYGPIIL